VGDFPLLQNEGDSTVGAREGVVVLAEFKQFLEANIVYPKENFAAAPRRAGTAEKSARVGGFVGAEQQTMIRRHQIATQRDNDLVVRLSTRTG